MNKIQTVDDLKNFMLSVMERSEGKILSASKMAKAKKTQSNSEIIASFRNNVKNFSRMVSRSQSSKDEAAPKNGYDSQRVLAVREAREKGFSKDSNTRAPRLEPRESKSYGNAPYRKSSGYNPFKVKQFREERAKRLEAFENGGGPGSSKVITPTEKDRYNPDLARELRELRELREQRRLKERG